MIALDANLLIYAYNRSAPQHVLAKAWFTELLEVGTPVGLPMQSILAFIRLTTTVLPAGQVFSIAQSVNIVDSWLSHPAVKVLHTGSNHSSIFQTLCLQAEAKSNLSTDAHLAALAIEHGATLHTADRHFSRFAGLKWQNPLAR